MDYTFKFNDTPRDQILTMMRYYQDRNDKRDADRRNSYMNLMQMLGRGHGAYKANQAYQDWKADQAYWNDEYGQLEDMENLPYTPVDNMTFMDYADDDAWLDSRINLAKLGL